MALISHNSHQLIEGTVQLLVGAYVYVLPTIPFIKKLHHHFTNVSQVWDADDLSSPKKIIRLHVWWSQLVSQGLSYGYLTNATKTWLVTK